MGRGDFAFENDLYPDLTQPSPHRVVPSNTTNGDEQLGTCDRFPGDSTPHPQQDDCKNWKPIAPLPAAQPTELERQMNEALKKMAPIAAFSDGVDQAIAAYEAKYPEAMK